MTLRTELLYVQQEIKQKCQRKNLKATGRSITHYIVNKHKHLITGLIELLNITKSESKIKLLLRVNKKTI